ncbi:MAG: S-methyl-5-thioribose-1-phosphate isomerase [Thermoplasmata archaeon]|nr:S-methyl-5-thioribose-1-phosphate isomerase [Thermoplasmata archaeon]
MRFSINGEEMDRSSFWVKDWKIILLDQRRLPSETVLVELSDLDEYVDAIKTLAIRGAPAIGAFGGCAYALCLRQGCDPSDAYNRLLNSRPTAVDLRNCLDEVKLAYEKEGIQSSILKAAEIVEGTIWSCRIIGKIGEELIHEGARVMTHCNAGALATLNWGTALAPIRIAHREGRNIFVWVSETRPLLQGSRLTAWELSQEGIPHRVVVDSACGYLMRKGEVDLVIVGADRVCVNGDFANKIGTYGKAVIAKELGIPFYVAFPETTFDGDCACGDDIPIEERGEEEVLEIGGNRVSPDGSEAFNPAFDVTPGKYVTGYITENGILDRGELLKKTPGPTPQRSEK